MLNHTTRLICGGALFAALGGVASAAIPGDGAQPADKPALNRASPMIYDPATTMAPNGTNAAPKDDVQADLPDRAKPALYRASPMINDPLIGTRIHGAPPKPSP